MTMPCTDRVAEVTRNTNETQIRVRVNLDGSGVARLSTGIGFFDHMLDQIARHGLIDLEIDAQGDLHIDGHHTVEDVGITLGQAVARAVGDKKGIRRHARAVQGRHGRRLRHPADLRIFPGVREPRAGHAAHRQPAR
jgi:imidazoleglycerol-phosphate dehydratase